MTWLAHLMTIKAHSLKLICDSSVHTLFLFFLSQGEICLCTSRIYVEKSIYAEFLERFVAATKKWKTGAPSDPSNNNGALISKEHLEKVLGTNQMLLTFFSIYLGLIMSLFPSQGA